MITPVKISASPVSTVLGGSELAPIAERTSERTTMMRTNDVDRTRMNGAIERSVRPAKISIGNVDRP
jgi:hypothetical protein